VIDDLKHFDEARQNQPKLAAMKSVINQVGVCGLNHLKYLLSMEASKVLRDFLIS